MSCSDFPASRRTRSWRPGADEVSLDGLPVLVCSLAHQRAMKVAADRPQDRADLAALPEA